MPIKEKAKRLEYQKQWTANRRKKYAENQVCVRCGASGELNLHHKNPGEKIDHRIWNWSVERLEDELRKCVWLCVGCHKTEHKSKQDHGTRYQYLKGCRCRKCKDAQAAHMRAYKKRRQERENLASW